MKTVLGLFLLALGICFGCSAVRPASSSSQQSPNTNSEPTPLAAATVEEKQPCPLTLSEAPVIKGVKLRMTPADVVKLFPGSKDDPEVQSQLSKPPSKFGVGSLVIRPDKFENKEDFKEISLITLTILDGRLSTISIQYRGPQWSHVDQFVDKFVENTNLPKTDQWEAFVGQDTQLKTLSCQGFSIQLYAGGEGGSLNYVLLEDAAAKKTLKDRKQKAREQASPTPNQ